MARHSLDDPFEVQWGVSNDDDYETVAGWWVVANWQRSGSIVFIIYFAKNIILA